MVERLMGSKGLSNTFCDFWLPRGPLRRGEGVSTRRRFVFSAALVVGDRIAVKHRCGENRVDCRVGNASYPQLSAAVPSKRPDTSSKCVKRRRWNECRKAPESRARLNLLGVFSKISVDSLKTHLALDFVVPDAVVVALR